MKGHKNDYENGISRSNFEWFHLSSLLSHHENKTEHERYFCWIKRGEHIVYIWHGLIHFAVSECKGGLNTHTVQNVFRKYLIQFNRWKKVARLRKSAEPRSSSASRSSGKILIWADANPDMLVLSMYEVYYIHQININIILLLIAAQDGGLRG